jgi:hypothetical protein
MANPRSNPESPADDHAAYRKRKKKTVQGSWPEHCEQRAFVAGAQWWEYEREGANMWPGDRDKAEAEAIRRYGKPSEAGRPYDK